MSEEARCGARDSQSELTMRYISGDGYAQPDVGVHIAQSNVCTATSVVDPSAAEPQQLSGV